MGTVVEDEGRHNNFHHYRQTVYVAVNGTAEGVVWFTERLKPTSPQAVQRLKSMGFDIILLTGDDEQTARLIGTTTGIERVISRVHPQEKAGVVKSLQMEGRKVAIVGDGFNDAPALAQADVGIAMGSGTDIAMETADITLMRGDLTGLADAIALCGRTVRAIRQNFFWAFLHNTLGIPLAGLGLLSPLVAEAAMAFSSVSVVGSSLRLRRFGGD